MKTVETIREMKTFSDKIREEGRSIGLVPTMGYFHLGHLSLVRASLKKADVTVVSIFINPSQFEPGEDFNDYPRDLVQDSLKLEKEGVDYLFTPTVQEMYPERYRTYIEVHGLQERMCGLSRPGHFRGVCTVVLKLFNIVQPDMAFFGQKDAQQAVILMRMVKDLDLDIEMNILPIVRSEDGLALSSRNTYLDGASRTAALALSESLKMASQEIERGEREPDVLKKKMKELILSKPQTRIDYIEIVDEETLMPLKTLSGRFLIALAVYLGKVRLIDNAIIEIKEVSREKNHAESKNTQCGGDSSGSRLRRKRFGG
ncbi:MAG: pantoate--beta-alanine ligase [Candidatus Aminicenantes bacterium]|nr:pantoate--beta-alanine ligase [Candidatus Aminicenantes bacterium]